MIDSQKKYSTSTTSEQFKSYQLLNNGSFSKTFIDIKYIIVMKKNKSSNEQLVDKKELKYKKVKLRFTIAHEL